MKVKIDEALHVRLLNLVYPETYPVQNNYLNCTRIPTSEFERVFPIILPFKCSWTLFPITVVCRLFGAFVTLIAVESVFLFIISHMKHVVK